ncbi:hypothetical protein BCV70DRAFT_80803 [Testicularia cyperi]|uniref:Uncharacterized protein n=1 Tax=Testicularia cyperi TaxID=1882483 RepID=A0A317XGZ6_9BASI|nr:hypothetical protein BCV70DRAFT_80803 [Testicularia cyperi]
MSRKRRQADGRLASPPLLPSPLSTRNVQLLPVGMTQLPNDVDFIVKLRQDIQDLVSTFAEAYLLHLLQRTLAKTTPEGALDHASSSTAQMTTGSTATNVAKDDRLLSLCTMFVEIWMRKGWHYTQFCFGDNQDSQRAFGDSICRVLLDRLVPHVNSDNAQTDFCDLKQLLEVASVPIAMYTFWQTQTFPDSGIGVKYCRRAMEKIPIEQDLYNWILKLPHIVYKHLEEEKLTSGDAGRITLDLIEIVARLCGQTLTPPDPTSAEGDKNAQDSPSSAASDVRRGKRKASEDENVSPAPFEEHATGVLDPIFDIIPARAYCTRRPRAWPSVRIMSRLEANREFGGLGSIVRVRDDQTSSEIGVAKCGMSISTRDTGTRKEMVRGLSRGDLIRLRARQRLDLAILDLPDLQLSSAETAADGSENSTSRAQNADSNGVSSTRKYRYEVDTPTWMGDTRYTARMKPWLDATTEPLQSALDRLPNTRSDYSAARSQIMQMLGDSAADAPDTQQVSEDEQNELDFTRSILDEFVRRNNASSEPGGDGATEQIDTGQASSNSATEDLALAAESGQTVQHLYRIAAERARRAIIQASQRLDQSARNLTDDPQ